MTVNFCLIWQLILLLFFLAQPSRAQENTVTFRAKLVDTTTQQPVTGAHIRSRKQQAISNGDGFLNDRREPYFENEGIIAYPTRYTVGIKVGVSLSPSTCVPKEINYLALLQIASRI
jgi:hypothetical protein